MFQNSRKASQTQSSVVTDGPQEVGKVRLESIGHLIRKFYLYCIRCSLKNGLEGTCVRDSKEIESIDLLTSLIWIWEKIFPILICCFYSNYLF